MGWTNIRNVTVLSLLASVFFGMQFTAVAADWPYWRGPHFNGTSDETGFSGAVSEDKIQWRTPMPGASSASPIVVGDRIYCVSNSGDMGALVGYCLNRDTGDVIWQKEFVSGVEQPRRYTLASPSPVTDGERIYFTFGTGDLIATDSDGKVVWAKNLMEVYGPISQQFGYSATPLPFKGKLYVAIMRGQWDRKELDDFTDEDSYLICLDPTTGDEVWKTHRSSDGHDEAFDSYTSPMPYDHDGVSAIITQGANYVIAHDTTTGKELWRQNHNPEMGKMWRLIPSPVMADGLVIGVQPRGLSPFAIRPEAGKSFAFDESLWIFDGKTTDVPTPVYDNGRVYLMNGVRKLLYCLDAKTGKELWVGEVDADSRIWSSPVVADGKMFCLTEEGQVVTMKVGDSFEMISTLSLGGKECKSTIAISDGKLFVRTSEALYCLKG
tara:strand:- start:2407 stop:3717 length:1311 start_codon:yes stop_codon:yes gene_type:complete